MIIRFLTQNDVAEHDKVTSQAFSYSCDIDDKNSVLPCEKVLGAFDDDNKTLFADLEIADRKCNYYGRILTCAAVGGVAAKPEHRGKGAVKALFDHLFGLSEYDISILYPFSEEYYRKLGYERAGRCIEATIPFSEISAVKRNQDARLYEGQNSGELLAIYNKCACGYNLSFVRENADAFPAKPYLSQKFTYIWKNSSFATIMIDRNSSTVYVEEIYFDSCESMLGIIGFLRNFEGNQKQICFQKIPENSPIMDLIRDYKNCSVKLYSIGAARIHNIEKVLKLHKYPSASGDFTIRICDETFRVLYSKDGTEVEKNSAYEPDAVMDTNTASQILLSGFEDAEYIPGLKIKNHKSAFFDSFTKKTSFFTDGF